RVPGAHQRLGLGRTRLRRRLDDPFAERERLGGGDPRVDRRGRVGHDITPTRTLRNRAPETPWPTCPVWPGSPLPQFGVPHICQEPASPTASIDRHSSYVMPVYVPFRYSWPSLPPLISRQTSVANWKFSRRSSIDQLRLVSNSNPSSVSSTICSNVIPGFGRRLTLVIRMSGMRFQPSARIAPPLRRPIRGAVSRELRYPTRMPFWMSGTAWAGTR